MKLFIKISIVLFLGISFWQCQRQTEVVVKTSGVSFNLTDEVNQLKSDVDVRAVIITVANKRGKLIYDNKRLELYSMGGAYLTEQLTMEVGEYTLEQFSVVNSNNEIVYITPKQGSELENLVRKALPIWFMVQENQATTVDVEVVSTDCNCPLEQFGYVSFSFDIVDENPEMFCVNINFSNEIRLSRSFLKITGNYGLDTIIDFLPPGVNSITFRNDGSMSFEIIHVCCDELGFMEVLVNKFVIERTDLENYSCYSDNSDTLQFIEVANPYYDTAAVYVSFITSIQCGDCTPTVDECLFVPLSNDTFYLTHEMEEFDENSVIAVLHCNLGGDINEILHTEPGNYTIWLPTNSIIERHPICGESISADQQYLKQNVTLRLGMNNNNIIFTAGATY